MLYFHLYLETSTFIDFNSDLVLSNSAKIMNGFSIDFYKVPRQGVATVAFCSGFSNGGRNFVEVEADGRASTC